MRAPYTSHWESPEIITVAASSRTRDQRLLTLAANYGVETLAALASNPKSPRLIVHPSVRARLWWVEKGLWYGKPQCSLFDLLATADIPSVRLACANNRRAPIAFLSACLASEDLALRVAATNALGLDGVDRLARSRDADIRLAACRALRIRTTTLVRLQRDRDRRVRDSANAAIKRARQEIPGYERLLERAYQVVGYPPESPEGNRKYIPYDPLHDYHLKEPSDRDLRRIEDEEGAD